MRNPFDVRGCRYLVEKNYNRFTSVKSTKTQRQKTRQNYYDTPQLQYLQNNNPFQRKIDLAPLKLSRQSTNSKIRPLSTPRSLLTSNNSYDWKYEIEVFQREILNKVGPQGLRHRYGMEPIYANRQYYQTQKEYGFFRKQTDSKYFSKPSIIKQKKQNLYKSEANQINHGKNQLLMSSKKHNLQNNNSNMKQSIRDKLKNKRKSKDIKDMNSPLIFTRSSDVSSLIKTNQNEWKKTMNQSKKKKQMRYSSQCLSSQVSKYSDPSQVQIKGQIYRRMI